MTQRSIRVSASRLKTLTECSLKFHYQEVEWLPQSTHWKTRAGSVTHLVFECVMNQRRPKRLALFKSIMETPSFNLLNHPALVRFTAWQLRREGIAAQCSVADIGQLLDVAWLGLRPHFTSTVDGKLVYAPPPRYVNEHRFQIKLSSGAVISGFIDLLLVWPDRAIVIDLKTQAAKFPQAELPSNVQGAMYQLVCYREEGFVPTVEFLMLRHPPGPRSPEKHIQRVAPPSVTTLAGLEVYVDAIYARVNAFTLEDALSNASSDTHYCQFKCGYLRPFTYWVVCSAEDPTGSRPISSHLVLDEATVACDDAGNGATVLERRHPGCMLRWNPNQNTAS